MGQSRRFESREHSRAKRQCCAICRAVNQKVVGSIPVSDVVSLGKALQPTCLGENVPVLTVSRIWIRASAK